QKKVLSRIIVAAVLMAGLVLLPIQNPYLRLALFMIPYLIIGYDILRKAFLGVIHGEVFDENFLMAVATVGAILLGEYTEGVAVMLFYQIGELFQSYAVGKSRGNIAKLMDIRPDYANVEVEGRMEQVDPDEVAIGTIITVQPGEKIPIDGVIEEGESSLNTSALTGESLPRQVCKGDEVISGSVNMSGLLKVRTTREFGESTVSKILELVENSSMKKSRSENFITRFARYYTPAVCYGALALAILPPVLCLVFGYEPHWSMWLTRALTTLVISCPCALVISIPLSFFGGIGGASAQGILVKGSNYLEALSETKYVVCDKTGTLTKGVFEVTYMEAAEGFTQESLIACAALAESYSGHPISRSLREAYGQEIDTNRVKDVEEISGHGVCAYVDGRLVAAGNRRLMEKLQITPMETKETGTQVHVAVDGVYAGCILISDVVKPGAAKALADLKKAGVRKIVMLTGDEKAVAENVASGLGVDEVRSELLPGDKVTEVERLLSGKGKKEKLAFVGDGINDAPVLSRADIGIAMGALGSDAAIEAADIVLMDDDPSKIALAMQISRKTLGIVRQNIVFALAVKLACLLLGAVGLVGMWWAIFADVGVMVLAVLNATRALATKRIGN
ncbi:MAG: cadmium-translocating P-type ATPase, partial [Lachnospiraceae bacterium]|nr:cadmium-translocating P-type ATPase [Lachnospiraceae bacterium]